MKKLLFLILLFPALLSGQEIKIIGPDKVEIGEYQRYDVVGITEDMLSKAELNYSPKKNVVVLPAKTWGGEPFLFFMSKEEGKHEITISLNEWRKSLKSSIVEAETAKIDPADIAKIKALDAELALKYPSAVGGITIQVGEGEPNPPGPDPPIPGQKLSIVIFRETGNQGLSLSQLEIVASRLFQEELEKEGHQFRQYDPQAAAGLPPKWIDYWNAVKDKKLPQVAVAPITGGDVRTFPLPENTKTFLKKLEGGE